MESTNNVCCICTLQFETHKGGERIYDICSDFQGNDFITSKDQLDLSEIKWVVKYVLKKEFYYPYYFLDESNSLIQINESPSMCNKCIRNELSQCMLCNTVILKNMFFISDEVPVSSYENYFDVFITYLYSHAVSKYISCNDPWEEIKSMYPETRIRNMYNIILDILKFEYQTPKMALCKLCTNNMWYKLPWTDSVSCIEQKKNEFTRIMYEPTFAWSRNYILHNELYLAYTQRQKKAFGQVATFFPKEIVMYILSFV